MDPGEECDDGNDTNGDGCSSDCAFEDNDGDGIVDVEDRCLLTRIPEGVPTQHLNANRYAIVTGTRNGSGVVVFDTPSEAHKKPGPVVTTADTGGCSCEQILAASGETHGQQESKLGCTLDTMQAWIRSLP